MTNLQEQLDNDLARIEELEDDRLLVLVAALYVENALGKLLISLLPGYDELQENKDFTFSLKIALVRSLRIIPLKLLNNADFIRKVRNAFVHDLSKESFTDLGDRYVQSMRDRASEYHPNFYNAKGPNDAFKLLSYCTVAGIYSLTNETALLNDFLRSPKSLFTALQAFLDEGWHV